MDNKYTEPIVTYADYLKSCEVFGVTFPLSEEEFNGNMVRFINVPGIISGANNMILRNGPRLMNAANKGADALKSEAIKVLLDEGLSQAKSILVEKGGGGGGLPNANSDGGSPNSLRGDYVTNPIKMEFNPGIVNRSYTSIVQLPNQDYSTTHLLGLKLQIPDDADTQYYFTNVLVPKLQQRAQATVNFRVSLTQMTSPIIQTYLNDCLTARQVLFFFTSLISYGSIPTNRDAGLLALRQMITVEHVNELNQLREILLARPCPPNLNTLTFFMSQTFQDSPDGDGLFKFMPISFATTTDVDGTVSQFAASSLGVSVIKDCINRLNLSDNAELASILTRIAPDWTKPVIFDPSGVPVYSKMASTIFANAPHTYWWNGANYLGPIVPSKDTPSAYISLDPNLDGAALGMWATFISGSRFPSFVIPVSSQTTIGGNTFNTNRLSFVFSSSSNTYIWRPSNRQIESAFGRMERVRAYQGNYYYAKLPGSLRLSNMTPNIANESAKDLLSWCMSIDTLQRKAPKSKKWTERGTTTRDEVDN